MDKFVTWNENKAVDSTPADNGSQVWVWMGFGTLPYLQSGFEFEKHCVRPRIFSKSLDYHLAFVYKGGF